MQTTGNKKILKASFSSAETIPTKLLRNNALVKQIVNNVEIPPHHVQFIPTNKCNLKCTYCSCADDDRRTEMSKEDAFRIIKLLSKCQTEAVTITGGGDPLEHPDIIAIIDRFKEYFIKVGLVTNGINLDKIKEHLYLLTWCRISHADDRPFNISYQIDLANIVQDSSVDWAFSYVVSSTPDIKKICDVIKFANKHNFSHVRLVSDILNPSNSSLGRVLIEIGSRGIDDSKVIYQGRRNPERGGDCYICYLKPVIGADGKVYTCCGAQYALDKDSRQMPKELCLGDALDMQNIMKDSHQPFDGSICKRCYYGEYNRVLSGLMQKTEHADFI